MREGAWRAPGAHAFDSSSGNTRSEYVAMWVDQFGREQGRAVLLREQGTRGGRDREEPVHLRSAGQDEDAGILWAFRKFAPTRPRLAGFCSGGLAGTVAAVVYAVHCTESAAAFVATWYTFGMLLPALLGLLIGPRVLRW